jgi:hypothetical protein
MVRLFRADPGLQLRWALIAAAVLVVFGLVFHKFETLVAGLLGFIGGLGAFIGVLRAAEQQVAAARQAAKDQVEAIQAERKQTDEQRLIVVKMAVRAEGWRLDKEVARVSLLFTRDLQQFFTQREFFIESSPLLRGEREDAALLGEMLATLEETAITLNTYNTRIGTAVSGTALAELQKTGPELLDKLSGLAAVLRDYGRAAP